MTIRIDASVDSGPDIDLGAHGRRGGESGADSRRRRRIQAGEHHRGSARRRASLTAYCTPPCEPLALQAEPLQVVSVIRLPPHGSTSIESDAGGVTVAVLPRRRPMVLTSSFVVAKRSVPLRVAR